MYAFSQRVIEIENKLLCQKKRVYVALPQIDRIECMLLFQRLRNILYDYITLPKNNRIELSVLCQRVIE